MSLQTFTDAYLAAALWSSTYEGTHPDGSPRQDCSLDDGEHEWAPEALARMRDEARVWYEAHRGTIDAAADTGQVRYGPDCLGEDARAGHDFWLTRCGHGCGFWDGDWPEPMAGELTRAAKAAGGRDLYIGDDGLIYLA